MTPATPLVGDQIDVLGAPWDWISKELRRPFAPEAIKFRLGGGGVLPYIDARVVIERLNYVVPGRWSTRFEPFPGGKQIVCHLTIAGVTRSDVGSQSQGQHVDPVKGGYSDALKRAAVHFGVGVSVYALARIGERDLPEGSVLERGKSKTLTKKGEQALRKGYAKWLAGPGKHFGEPLSHGDVEDAIGDVEAAPAEPAAGEAVEQQSLETGALVEKLTKAYSGLPVGIRRKHLPKAKFDAWMKAALAAAEDRDTQLKSLQARIEGLAVEQ